MDVWVGKKINLERLMVRERWEGRDEEEEEVEGEVEEE